MVVIERIPGASYPLARVRVTAQPADFDLPWVRVVVERTGVAVVIGPRRLVTLASVVADAIAPAVIGPEQTAARIAAIDHDRDLALLETDAEIGIEPAELGDQPVVGQALVIAGLAGEGSCIVAGISLARYAHSQRHLLAIAIDGRQPLQTAGDAAFRNRRLAGLVMQRSSEDDHKGDMIPPALIRAFVDAADAGAAPGVPALGIVVQSLENTALRAALGLSAQQGGVLVTRVDRGGTCDGALRPRDVLLSIDGVPVADDGRVPYAGVALRHYVLLGTRRLGERVRLGLWRDGAQHDVEVVLAPWLPLVPRARHEAPPAYFVYAGLVFQPLTRDYLTTWEAWWDKAPKGLLHAYYAGFRTEDRDELIVLTSITDDAINAGYAQFVNETVVRVGDVVPRDLSALARALEAAHGHVLIEMSSGAVLAFDAGEVRALAERR